jgi:acetyl-CoA synthetase
MGRIDDVMNVSGHRISTTEVESALVDHPDVAEAAVVGQERRRHGSSDLRVRHVRAHAKRLAGTRRRAARHVAEKLGKFTTPKYLTFTQELPKTRSGKIMRRLLRDIAEGRMLGDTTTLADSSARPSSSATTPRSVLDRMSRPKPCLSRTIALGIM